MLEICLLDSGNKWKAIEKWREVQKAGRRRRKSREGDCISPEEKKRRRARPLGITQFEDEFTQIDW